MSRTYNHGRVHRYWRDLYDKVWHRGHKADYLFFNICCTLDDIQHPDWARYYYTTPSWFTRLYSNLPKRRESKHLCHEALKLSPEDTEGLIFPLDKKPSEYYW